jgi:hypothetical protein
MTSLGSFVQTLYQTIAGEGVPIASQGIVIDSPTFTYITSGGFSRKCGGAVQLYQQNYSIRYKLFLIRI